MADSGRLVKMEVDYSVIVERRLPELQEMAKVRNRSRENGGCDPVGTRTQSTKFTTSVRARWL